MPGKHVTSLESAPQESPARAHAFIEIGLIFVLFFVLAGSQPPDVNEAHYLAKAKHYWNPEWCAGDLFLQSADAHVTFYWAIGWLTKYVSLEATAWIGRCVTWLLLAWSWQRLSRAVAPGWLWSVLTAACLAMFLRLGHMAGEWVIGGVEAKGFAFTMLFLGLEALVRGRWSRMWLLLGAASAFHVLVGGWAVVAAMLAWIMSQGDRPPLVRMLPALIVGGMLALPGLIPVLLLSTDVDAATLREANELYVRERLAHHLLFSHILSQRITLGFPYLNVGPWELPLTHLYFARHALLLLGGIGMWLYVRPRGGPARLYLFVAGSIVIALVGIAIDQATLDLPSLSASLLRYYWFRLSDVMVPLGVACVLAQTLQKLQSSRPAVASAALAVTLLAVTLNVSDVFARRLWDPRPPAVAQSNQDADPRQRRYEDWLRACEWLQQTSRGSIVLTPRAQQTFHWYAGRAEVVSWKGVPQDAAGLMAWKQRMQDVFPPEALWYGLIAHGEEGLIRLADKYGFQYVMLDRSRSRGELSFPKVYPRPGEANANYEVYHVPTRHESP